MLDYRQAYNDFKGMGVQMNSSKTEDDSMPHLRSHSLSGLQSNESPSHQIKGEKGSYSQSGTTTVTTSQLDAAQLKYENDRLKLALAQR